MTGAYCGPPPLPAALAESWNADPAVILPLIALLLVAAWRRNGYLAGGVAVLAVAFVSPLCALSTALFSARVLHHVLLIAFAAPLLALALPRGGGGGARGLFLLHLAAVWIWHAPGPYAWALGSWPAYWLMQASLLGSAVLLWRAVLAAPVGVGIALLAGTAMQMGFLGALLVFAGRPLYAPHLMTTEPFGLSPLEDQQLAGLLMWVPAALPYLAATLVRLGAVFPAREGRP